MENFNKLKLLGKGGFGSAFLCVNKLDGKNYVIKEVDVSRMSKPEREAAEQEAKVRLERSHHFQLTCCNPDKLFTGCSC
jgi:NIMA (never in mitosis gene a)-related kinase